MFDDGPRRIIVAEPSGLDILPLIAFAILALLAIGTIVMALRIAFRRRPTAPRGKVSNLVAIGDGTPDRPTQEKLLTAVAASDFEQVPLLNKPETALFALLARIVADTAPGHYPLAQISLGEALRPTTDADRLAFFAINAKRIDMGVMAPNGRLILAIEYQGSGHHQRAAFLRDAVKREALRKGGVPLLEVEAGADADLTAARLRDALVSRTS